MPRSRKRALTPFPLYCGTSGFSYKEWKGPFYPEKLPAGEMLAYYGSRLPAVEINNTFYRLPNEALIDGWREQVPETFRFAVKMSRRITHVKRLADCEEEASRFFRVVARLEHRLGVALIQLPPHFRIDVERLKRFLGLVPADIPAAFEFRHASWQDEAVLGTLKEHGAAWVHVDDAGASPSDVPRPATWIYLRLRAPAYSVEALRAWRQLCLGFDRAYVFFKHEDEGIGPALAERMLTLE